MNNISHVSTILAWYILPGLFGNVTLKVYYFLFPSQQPRLNPTRTQAEADVFNKRNYVHNRNTRITLVLLYLIYLLFSSYFAQKSGPQQNVYDLLRIDRSIVLSESGKVQLRSHFRTLSKIYHPDKVGANSDNSTEYFIKLRAAYDLLTTNVSLRTPYELFGEQVQNWGKMNSEREYLVMGVRSSAGWYIGTGLLLFGLGWLQGIDKRVSFYRYLLLFWFGVIEFGILLNRKDSFLFPDLLPYQKINLLHSAFSAICLSLNSIFPYFLTPEGNVSQNNLILEKEQAELKELGTRLNQMNELITRELQDVAAHSVQPLMQLPVDGITLAHLETINHHNTLLAEDLTNKMLKSYSDQIIQSSPAKIWQLVESQLVPPTPSTPILETPNLPLPPLPPQLLRNSPSHRILTKSKLTTTEVTEIHKPKRSNSITSLVGGEEDFRSPPISPIKINHSILTEMLDSDLKKAAIEVVEASKNGIGSQGEVVDLD